MSDNSKILEWDNLSMTDRAKYIKTGVESGLSNMEDIKKAYKIYAEGGPMEEPQLQDDSLEENSSIENVPIRKTSGIPIGKTPNIPIKRKYDSYTPIEIQEDTDNYKERDVVFHYRNMPYNEINEAVEALSKEGATKAQIAGMLGNAAHESNMRGGKQIGGPAKGYFQLEAGHRNKYEEYLKDNNLQDNLANEAVYAFRYTNNNTSNKTPYESQDSKIWKDRWSKHSVYQGITTEDAYRKWNQNNPDSTSDAFLNLFEKAGVPSDQIRRDYSSKFYFDKNINWEEYFPNIKAKGGPLDSELYIDHSYVPYKPMNPEEYAKTIINPVFQHQSDRLIENKTVAPEKFAANQNAQLKAQDKSEEAIKSFHDKNPLAETKFGRYYNDNIAPIGYLLPGFNVGMSLADVKHDIEKKDFGSGLLDASMVLGAVGTGGIGKLFTNIRSIRDIRNYIKYKDIYENIAKDSYNRALKKYAILSEDYQIAPIKEYPIKNIRLRESTSKKFRDKNNTRAYLEPSTNKIFLRKDMEDLTEEGLRGVLSHELDHYYQRALGNLKILPINENSAAYKRARYFEEPFLNKVVDYGHHDYYRFPIEIADKKIKYFAIPDTNAIRMMAEQYPHFLIETPFKELLNSTKANAWYKSPGEFIAETGSYIDGTTQKGEIYRNLSNKNKSIVREKLKKRFGLDNFSVDWLLQNASTLGYLKYGGKLK